LGCRVSIGAINAAIIAGNLPHRRIAQLHAFWDLITERKIWAHTPDGDVFRKARNATSSMMTMVGGQPGFFTPRSTSPWLSITGAQGATSYYDSSPLRRP
jgi:NTE family protein